MFVLENFDRWDFFTFTESRGKMSKHIQYERNFQKMNEKNLSIPSTISRKFYFFSFFRTHSVKFVLFSLICFPEPILDSQHYRAFILSQTGLLVNIFQEKQFTRMGARTTGRAIQFLPSRRANLRRFVHLDGRLLDTGVVCVKCIVGLSCQFYLINMRITFKRLENIN